MEKLTSKQEKILTTIKKFIAKNGYSPTIRELCTLCSLNSTATMFVHLKNLTKKGYINQTGSKFRTIELVVPNEYDKNYKDISEILSNMSEDEYYKGWCTREEDNAFMDYQTGLENGKETLKIKN